MYFTPIQQRFLVPLVDKRGKHGKQGLYSTTATDNLFKVIDALPKYDVHYWNEEKNQEKLIFLEPDCTLDKVYELFKSENENSGVQLLGNKQPSKTWFMKKVKESFPHLRVCSCCKERRLQ